MSKEYPCVYYDHEKCKKFSDDSVISYCVQGPCHDETPSNADRIRAMSDEELLEFMKESITNAYMCKIMRTEPMFLTLEWLKQPPKEE